MRRYNKRQAKENSIHAQYTSKFVRTIIIYPSVDNLQMEDVLGIKPLIGER